MYRKDPTKSLKTSRKPSRKKILRYLRQSKENSNLFYQFLSYQILLMIQGIQKMHHLQRVIVKILSFFFNITPPNFVAHILKRKFPTFNVKIMSFRASRLLDFFLLRHYVIRSIRSSRTCFSWICGKSLPWLERKIFLNTMCSRATPYDTKFVLFDNTYFCSRLSPPEPVVDMTWFR